MADQNPSPARAGTDLQKTAVEVQTRENFLELRFRGRFLPADLEAVKAIRGRKWDHERRVWLLPDTPAVMTALRLSFRFEPSVPAAAEDMPAAVDSLPTQPRAATSAASYNAETIRLLEEVRRTIRAREYSPKTERSYLG